MPESPKIAVFGPSPVLSVVIERRGSDRDQLHVHAAGQGVWVGRMAAELGAYPVQCAFLGGEVGAVLRPMLEAMEGELRIVETAANTSSWVVDHRSGVRETVAHDWSDIPSRHEVDQLFSETCAAALEAKVLALTGPIPGDALPLDTYSNLVRDGRAAGATTVVDLGSPKLDNALQGGPDVVHVNDWQLAELIRGPVDDPDEFFAAAGTIVERGAGTVVVTRGGDPALVLRGDQAWELLPPKFEGGTAAGGGDSMVGALAAGIARDLPWEDTLRLGAAAGAANFLRHGLGTASRDVVEQLVERVELRRL